MFTSIQSSRAPNPWLIAALGLGVLTSAKVGAQVPAFAGPVSLTPANSQRVAVLAGGCFWGMDAVFKHVKGVKSVVSGYAGGSAKTAMTKRSVRAGQVTLSQ